MSSDLDERVDELVRYVARAYVCTEAVAAQSRSAVFRHRAERLRRMAEAPSGESIVRAALQGWRVTTERVTPAGDDRAPPETAVEAPPSGENSGARHRTP